MGIRLVLLISLFTWSPLVRSNASSSLIEDLEKECPLLYKKYGGLWREGIRRAALFENASLVATQESMVVAKISPLVGGGILVDFQEGSQDAEKNQRGQKHRFFNWTDMKRPLPLCEDVNVLLQSDRAGEIIGFSLYTFGDYRAVQKRHDGSLDFVLVSDFGYTSNPPSHAKRHYFRVAPTYTDLRPGFFRRIEWRRHLGTFVTGERRVAGDDDAEEESRQIKVLGWPIDNDPGKNIVPGRGGWVLFETISKNRETGSYEGFIPESHYGTLDPYVPNCR